MVWSAAAAERPSPQTTLLILPPLPVPLIAEQWDEQLPPAAAVPPLLESTEDGAEKDQPETADAKPGKLEGDDRPIDDAEQDLARQRTASPPTSSAKRKREDSAGAEGADGNARQRARAPALHNLAPSRHPRPVAPTDEAHPYNHPTQLTASHLTPEVLAEARSIAARQGIKLDIPLDDPSIDARAYNDALANPSTVGSGAIAQAKALSARKRFTGSVDGLSAVPEGHASASPAPGTTPVPSGAQTPTTASPAVSVRGAAANRGKNKGQGRWGHLYAKRAQQAAAAKAEKERSALLAAGVAVEESKVDVPETPATAVIEAPPAPEMTPEELAEQKEREERERAEQAEAARLLAEEKKREAMAKALGSASYWNHLLIEARRQRGPQWDVNTQLYQVDRGSALYYSDVRGPPATPPPVEKELPDAPKAADPPTSAVPTPLAAEMVALLPGQPAPQRIIPPPVGLPAQQIEYMHQQQQQQQQQYFEQQQRVISAARQQSTPRQQMQRLGSIPGDHQATRAMSGTPGSEHDSQARPQSAGRQTSVQAVNTQAYPQSQQTPQLQQHSTPSQQQQQFQRMMQGMPGHATGTPTPMRPPAAMKTNPAQTAAAGQYSQVDLARMHRQLQEQSMSPQQLQQMQQMQQEQQMQQMQDMMRPHQQAGLQGMQGQTQQLQAQALQAQMAMKQREMLQARMQGMSANQYAGQVQGMQAQQQRQGAQPGMSVGLNGNATFPQMSQGMSPQQTATLQAQVKANPHLAQHLMQQASQGMYNGMASTPQQQPTGGMVMGGKMQINGGGTQLTPQQMQQMYALHQAQMAQQASNNGR